MVLSGPGRERCAGGDTYGKVRDCFGRRGYAGFPVGVTGWVPVGVVLWMSLVRPVEGASGVCDTSVL